MSDEKKPSNDEAMSVVLILVAFVAAVFWANLAAGVAFAALLWDAQRDSDRRDMGRPRK